MKFLIQTIENQVKHDFSFTLLESIRYQNWYNGDNYMSYLYTNDTGFVALKHDNLVPVGSNEFVISFIKANYNLNPKPKNIPFPLLDKRFTKRHIFDGCEKDIQGTKFVKSNEKIKSFTEITDTAPKGLYQISEIIEIESEWRAFVFKNKLVGLQNYSGNFAMFPDVNAIEGMIDEYKEFSPVAYTLDVGINLKDGTFVIEVHDFFSCGLYGFSDHKIYPFMLSQWFFSYILHNKIK